MKLSHKLLLLLSGSVSVAALSGAATLASGEAQALAIDFTDNAWQSATGHYGSIYVKDTTTPANDRNASAVPYDSLTYTSPSAKMTLGPAGTLRFGAHNLYLNSASPANQSITVVSGATYAIDITGSVSVTASGAATGTWTAGTTTFTAATTTLTLGSTSGAGTVSVRRTPSDDKYLATTSAARYDLPYEWNSAGVLQGVLVEEARTNLVTYSNTFSNAAWTKDLCSVSQNVDSPLGTGTGWTLTATAGTGSRWMYAGAAHSGTGCNSFIAKAGTASWICVAYNHSGIDGAYFNLAAGTIGTVRAGVTATMTDLGGGWYRCSVVDASTPSAYCLMEIHTADNQSFNWTAAGTETILIAGAQAETGSFPTSYIPTLASTVTRAADNISLATSAFPTAANQTFLVEGRLSAASVNSARFIGTQTNTTPLFVTTASTTQVGSFDGTDLGYITASNLLSNTKLAFAGDAADASMTSDGAAATAHAAVELPTITAFYIGHNNGVSVMTGYIKKIMYLPRRASNAQLVTLTTP